MMALHPKVFKDPRMDAKRMFQNVLGAWAMDVLALRRRGWDRPCVRELEAAFGLTARVAEAAADSQNAAN